MPWSSRLSRLSFAIVTGGLVGIGVAAAGLAYDQARADLTTDEQRAVTAAATTFEAHLLGSLDRLRGASGLTADGEVTGAEFAAFAAEVIPGSVYPALALIDVVGGSQRTTWEREHGRGILDTDGAGGLQPATDRPTYYPVRESFPRTATTARILGFDIGSDAVRLRGVELAVEQGTPVLVGPVSLASSAAPGLFAINAVRNPDGAVIGFVASGQRVDALLDSASGLDADTVSLSMGDERLVGDSDAGASWSFIAGGQEFTLSARSNRQIDLLLPAALLGATVVIAGVATFAAIVDRRARRRQDLLLRRQESISALGQRLAGAQSVDEVTEIALADAGDIVQADYLDLGRVDSADASKLVVAHDRASDDDRPLRYEVQAMSAPLPLTDAVRLNRPVLLPSRERYVEAYPEAEGSIEPSGLHAVLVKPITFAGGIPFACLGFGWKHALSDAELVEVIVVVRTVTQLVGRALERAVTSEALDDRSTRLGRFAQELARGYEPGDVDVIVGLRLAELVDARRAGLTVVPTEPRSDTAHVQRRRLAGRSDGTLLEVEWDSPLAATPAVNAVLTTAAAMIEEALERAEVHAHQHELLEQLQRALLGFPSAPPGLDVAAQYEPALSAVAIGGDWYDLIVLDADVAAVVLGDVAGHGTDAVGVMAEVKAVVHHMLSIGIGLAEVCAHADACLRRHETYATMFVAYIDVRRGELRYLNAGHLPPLLATGENVAPLTGGRRVLLGVEPDRAVEVGVTSFGIDDVVAVFTDGLVEDRRTSNDGVIAELSDVLRTRRNESAQVLVSELFACRASPSRQHPTDDDAAVVVVRRTG